MISIGNFFFRHRNWVFPVMVVLCFAMGVPPARMFGSSTAETIKDGVAVLLAIAGLSLRALVIGYVHVSRAGRGRRIHAASLYTDGIFSLCRNPLYTGNVMVFTGIFLMHGAAATMLVGIPSFLFVYHALVRAEESYLRTTFGPQYVDYCARVPRWIPAIWRLGTVTRDMRFDLRRVLLVEYPNIGIAVIALTSAEFYEDFADRSEPLRSQDLTILAGIAGLAVVFVLCVRFAKKKRLIVVG